jgi:pyruvate formate lyase activating enzyme
MDPQKYSGNNIIECTLCPHYCKIKVGNSGICGVRKNNGERIELTTYGVLSGSNSDPVEKKPLYHFFPGNKILSIGSYGCNMRCDFCQNYSISQVVPDKMKTKSSPDEIAKKALDLASNIGIAFTYNEPVIWFEFMRDVALAVKAKGMYTAIVSNGYVNPEPLNEITGFIDAFNIDLKAFNNSFYRKLTGSDITPVKESLKQIALSGKHLEITTLIIPGQNDSESEMAAESEWIASELGRDVPLHLSRYYPMHRRNDPPVAERLLKKLFDIASANLDYVYLGNLVSDSGQNTACPGCGKTVTIRSGYVTRLTGLDESGRCKICGKLVYSYFTLPERAGC